MNPSVDLNKLLSFILEQPEVYPKILNYELMLWGEELYVEIKLAQDALDLCKITIVSHEKGNKAIFFESMDKIKPFLNSFHERLQQGLFKESQNEYIQRNGPQIRADFIAQVQDIKSDFDSHLTRQDSFHGKYLNTAYSLEFATLHDNNGSGIWQFKYSEPSYPEHETFLIFTNDEINQLPLLKHMGQKYFKQSNSDISQLSTPLIDYFLMQEKLPAQNTQPSKPKL